MAKTITAAMTTLLAGRKWYTAKLFTFTLNNGAVLTYTSFDRDLVLSGTTYSSGGTTGPYFEQRGKKATTKRSIGVSVDSMMLTVIPGTWTVDGIAFGFAVRLGLFDGADFLYQRVNMATPGDTSAGAIPMFGGKVGKIDFSLSAAEITIESYLKLLNIQMPRNLYQAGCQWTLYDTGCGLNPATFAAAGTVASASSGQSFAIAGAAAGKPAAYFNLGKVQFTSGQNAGFWAQVQSHTTGPATLNVFPPFGFTPQAGDAFTAYPGCDLTQTTCTNKFSNLPNFRAMPYTPQVSTGL